MPAFQLLLSCPVAPKWPITSPLERWSAPLSKQSSIHCKEVSGRSQVAFRFAGHHARRLPLLEEQRLKMDFQPLPGNPPDHPEPVTAPPPTGERRRSLKTWVFAGVGAAALVIGGAGISAASSSGGPNTQTPTTIQPGGAPAPHGAHHDHGHHDHGHGVGGTIASTDGTTLTVTARSGGTVTVTTSADTTVTKSTTGAVSDIHVGDHVLVMGQATGTNVTARGIADFRAAQPPARPKDDPDPNRTARPPVRAISNRSTVRSPPSTEPPSPSRPLTRPTRSPPQRTPTSAWYRPSQSATSRSVTPSTSWVT